MLLLCLFYLLLAVYWLLLFLLLSVSQRYKVYCCSPDISWHSYWSYLYYCVLPDYAPHFSLFCCAAYSCAPVGLLLLFPPSLVLCFFVVLLFLLSVTLHHLLHTMIHLLIAADLNQPVVQQFLNSDFHCCSQPSLTTLAILAEFLKIPSTHVVRYIKIHC